MAILGNTQTYWLKPRFRTMAWLFWHFSLNFFIPAGHSHELRSWPPQGPPSLPYTSLPSIFPLPVGTIGPTPPVPCPSLPSSTLPSAVRPRCTATRCDLLPFSYNHTNRLTDSRPSLMTSSTARTDYDLLLFSHVSRIESSSTARIEYGLLHSRHIVCSTTNTAQTE
jgi:hypothetical protein